LVIGADGASGGVARLAGLRDGWRPWELASALVRTVETTGEWDAVEFRLIPVLFGMGWVFPLGHGRLNVGVAGHYRVRAYLKPWLNYITQSVRGTPASSDRAWILPAGGLPRRFAGGRVLLAGDAAGFVSPLTGEGIRYAVESGAIAGKLALNAFCSGSLASLPRVYTRVCNREIVPDFRGDLWRSVLWGKRQLVPLKTIAREFYNKLARTADSPFGAAL
jgi:flavin-dependent dehydrogenase